MAKNLFLKRKSLELRLRGFSYSEIQEHILVSISTLSLWLHEVKLSREQNERLMQKLVNNRKLGSLALRRKRLEITKRIIRKAKTEVKELNNQDL